MSLQAKSAAAVSMPLHSDANVMPLCYVLTAPVGRASVLTEIAWQCCRFVPALIGNHVAVQLDLTAAFLARSLQASREQPSRTNRSERVFVTSAKQSGFILRAMTEAKSEVVEAKLASATSMSGKFVSQIENDKTFCFCSYFSLLKRSCPCCQRPSCCCRRFALAPTRNRQCIGSPFIRFSLGLPFAEAEQGRGFGRIP
jgi:hypothetical protein